jgi:hypothetical protein
VARANCLTMTFSQSVSPVVVDCINGITSCQREKLGSNPTACGRIDNMLRATFERLVYFECVSSCWCHQSVISGCENELLIPRVFEW